MQKVVTSKEMREMDRYTIQDLGIPGAVLMENAGLGTTRVIQKMIHELPAPTVYIFCGKGNNGGDGYVIARHLWDNGVQVRVFIAGEEKEIKGDALINYNVIKKLALPIKFISTTKDLRGIDKHAPDLVVDALLGTGIQGAVYGFMKEVIEFINGIGCPIVAVDIPSGLNADSPAVEGSAVQADVTVTMALPKICHVFYPAKQFVGELYITDIGIPHTTRNSAKVKIQMVEEVDIQLPHRHADTHKYKSGKVAVIAGSPGYTGAAALSAEAALRIGAGLVILAVPEELNPILETKLTEVITRPYDSKGRSCLVSADNPEIRDLLEWCDVLAIGPGLGRAEETQQAIVKILKSFKKPVVIDADALFALSSHLNIFSGKHLNWVLTPHHGEFLRLLPGVEKQKLQNDFPELAQKFAGENQLTLLLKGAPSLVAEASGQIYINSTGNAGLAKGGTGDVLTGFVAGLLAQGLPPVEAAYTANFIHGLLANELLAEKDINTFFASDLLHNIGPVLKKHFEPNGD